MRRRLSLPMEEGMMAFLICSFCGGFAHSFCAATCDRCMGEVGSSGGMMPVGYHTPEGGVLPACVKRRDV